MSYEPYEERPDGDWALALFPPSATTGTVNFRLFPSFEKAENLYGRRNTACIYQSAEELAQKIGGAQLLYSYRQINERPACHTAFKPNSQAPHLDDLPDDAQYDRVATARALWELCQAIGDRVRGANVHTDLDEDLFIVRLDRLTMPAVQEEIATYVKQKRIICEGLIELGKTKLLEAELEVMMHDLVRSGRLKTKQDPWRIFRYYAPELGDDGLLYYPTKRHKREDHEQNI